MTDLPEDRTIDRHAARMRAWAIAVGVVAALLYSGTLGHGYVLDDASVIHRNDVTKQGVAGIPTILTTAYRHGYWDQPGTLYRPLSRVLFAIEWSLSPGDPSLGHLINVALYAVIGSLLVLLLARLFREETPVLAILAALVFVAHPVHTEVVANIKSRDELLALLFMILALRFVLQHVDGRSVRPLVLANVMFFLALMSKESAITMPGVIPLALLLFRPLSVSAAFRLTAVFAAPAVAYLAARRAVLGSLHGIESVSALDNVIAGAGGYGERLATCFMILWRQLELLVVAHPLVCDYSLAEMSVVGWGDPEALAGLVVCMGLLAVALWQFRRNRVVSFAILFFFVTISISSNVFVLIGSHMADRFLFVPSLGFATLVAWAFAKLSGLSDAEKGEVPTPLALWRGYPGMVSAAVAVLGIAAVLTVERAADWKDDYTLYSTDVRTSASARLHFFHGLELMLTKPAEGEEERQLNLDLAIAELRSAVRTYPAYVEAWEQQGVAWYRKRDFAAAMDCYGRALALDPNRASTHNNVGALHFDAGRVEEARASFASAVRLDPDYGDAWRNLGSALGTLGRLDEAVAAFRSGLTHEPDSALLNYYLAVTLEKQGDSNASSYYERAYALDPGLRK